MSNMSYYMDHNMSEVDSETSTTLHAQIPTPHFGESYSQAGYSPVMLRRQGKPLPTPNSSNSVQQGGGGAGKEGCPGEEEDGTEFVDNDAYITFSAAPAKFQIVGEEKGNVFETVRVREEVYVADS